ncbi:hypothetical protein HN958_03275 [Candidatus Falkowbacteria bacterium]|jgi:hypothetical protein|nr:hypothetical protein [Candidatus Falkowbacteria bacterium]MBT7007498.1 hypothetical protein [Candidatus Falkowbacteria bacterium]
MKLAKPKEMVPKRLAKIIPPCERYGMFNNWDSQNWEGDFESIDGTSEENKALSDKKERPLSSFRPFPKGLKTEHRFSFFGRTHLPDKE